MKKSLKILFLLLITFTWACKDDVAPVIVLEGDTNMTHTLNQAFVEPGYSAFDDKDGELTTKVEVSNLDVNTAGEQTITYRVKDAEGNEGIATRKVQVKNQVSDLAGSWSAAYIFPYPGIEEKTYAEVIQHSGTVNLGIVFKNFGGNTDANVTAKVASSANQTSLSFEAQNVGGGALTVESATLENRNRITIEYKIGATRGVMVMVKN